MKSKTFYVLIFSAMLLVINVSSSCSKDPFPPIGGYPPPVKYIPSTVHESPFFEYLWYHGLQNVQGGPEIIKENSDGPLEIGYSFTSSIPGIVDKLGIMLPDSGKTYAVSLWDGVTKELLVQKNIQILNPNLFNYVDLLPTNEFKVILPNHPYMIGVYTAHISATPNLDPDEFYHVIIDQGNIFPFTGYPHVVNFNQEYIKYTESPTFPNDLWTFGYVITGLCDIEFTYVQPIK